MCVWVCLLVALPNPVGAVSRGASQRRVKWVTNSALTRPHLWRAFSFAKILQLLSGDDH